MKQSAQVAHHKFSAMQKHVPTMTTPWKKERPHHMRPGRVSDSVLRKLGIAPENTMATTRSFLPTAHVTGEFGHQTHGVEQPMMTTPALPGGKYDGGTDGVTITKASSVEALLRFQSEKTSGALTDAVKKMLKRVMRPAGKVEAVKGNKFYGKIDPRAKQDTEYWKRRLDAISQRQKLIATT